MAFIEEQKIIPTKELSVKIEVPVYEDIKRYAEFRKGTPAYVVEGILRKVMANDKDFQAFLHPEAEQTPKRAKKERKAIAAVA